MTADHDREADLVLLRQRGQHRDEAWGRRGRTPGRRARGRAAQVRVLRGERAARPSRERARRLRLARRRLRVRDRQVHPRGRHIGARRAPRRASDGTPRGRAPGRPARDGPPAENAAGVAARAVVVRSGRPGTVLRVVVLGHMAALMALPVPVLVPLRVLRVLPRVLAADGPRAGGRRGARGGGRVGVVVSGRHLGLAGCLDAVAAEGLVDDAGNALVGAAAEAGEVEAPIPSAAAAMITPARLDIDCRSSSVYSALALPLPSSDARTVSPKRSHADAGSRRNSARKPASVRSRSMRSAAWLVSSGDDTLRFPRRRSRSSSGRPTMNSTGTNINR